MTPEQVKDKLTEREGLTAKHEAITRALSVESPTIKVTIEGKTADGTAVKETIVLNEYWPLFLNMLEEVSDEHANAIASIESLFSQL